ncbi:phage terminase small subunit P27 family [Hymenobacter sp. HD11105]
MAGGRPRKPTSLKKLAGTDQPCRTNEQEPVPDVALPLPPAWLSPAAKEYWGEIGAVLLSMKLVTAAEGPALMLLTDALAEWVGARKVVLKSGRTYKAMTEHGFIMRPRPEVAIASDAWKRAMRMLVEFGLTPASRSKVSAIGEKEGKDPFAQMMEDMKG